MIEISIEGLNARQRVLADIIWACKDRASVDKFVAGLPSVALRKEAASIVDLMILATIEQCYDGLGSMDEAEKVLQKYNGRIG